MTVFWVKTLRTKEGAYLVYDSCDNLQRYATIHEAMIAVQHALMLNLSHENEQRTKDKRG